MKKRVYDIALGVVFIIQAILVGVCVSLSETNKDASSFAIGIAVFVFVPVFVVLLFARMSAAEKEKNAAARGASNVAVTPKAPAGKIAKTYVIRFPFYGVRTDGDDNWTYFDGKEVYKWLSNDEIEGINNDWNLDDAVKYVDDKKLKDKLYELRLSVCNDGMCKVVANTYDKLTVGEEKNLINFVKGQASDGWGEGNFGEFQGSDGKPFELDFWDNEKSYIEFAELDDSGQEQVHYIKETNKYVLEITKDTDATSSGIDDETRRYAAGIVEKYFREEDKILDHLLDMGLREVYGDILGYSDQHIKENLGKPQISVCKNETHEDWKFKYEGQLSYYKHTLDDHYISVNFTDDLEFDEDVMVDG